MNNNAQALEQLRAELRNRHRSIYNDSSKIEIGDFTYGDPIICSWAVDGEENARCIIGKFCSIGGNVQILLGGNHRNDWISTYPFNVLLKEQYGYISGQGCNLNIKLLFSNLTSYPFVFIFSFKSILKLTASFSSSYL